MIYAAMYFDSPDQRGVGIQVVRVDILYTDNYIRMMSELDKEVDIKRRSTSLARR